MRRHILLSIFFALIFSGCDADTREVNRKANFLCENGFADKIILQVWPKTEAVDQYIVAEDLKILRAEEAEQKANPFVAMLEGLREVVAIAHEATLPTISCDVQNTSIHQETATVDLVFHGKRITNPGETLIQDVAQKPDRASKVAHIRTLLESGETVTETYSLKFQKVGDNWLADYGIAAQRQKEAAEKAAAAQKEEQLKTALAEALTLVKEKEWKTALQLLKEFKPTQPDEQKVDDAIESIEEMLKNIIGERWTIDETKDAMTDETNVVVRLEGEEKTGTFGTDFASIIIRCKKGKLESFINLGQILDRNWRSQRTPIKLRFGSGEPIPMSLSTSTSLDAVFMKPDFLDTLEAHPNTKLAVEYTPHSSGPVVTTFKTAGSDVVVARVKQACGK